VAIPERARLELERRLEAHRKDRWPALKEAKAAMTSWWMSLSASNDLHLEVFHNDLSTHTADGSCDLPIPATFVINRSGIVRARYVSADYTTRMDPDDIEAALAALK